MLQNAFLAGLAAPDFALLRSHLVPLELRPGDCLHCMGERIEDVIFPQSGLVIMSIPLREGSAAGVSLVGREGVIGAFAAAASAPATCDAEVYIAGHASRMAAAAFRYLMDQSPAIRRLAARLDTATMAQVQQTALCNAAHPVEARVCRLLLEVQDRGSTTKVPLTQAVIAQILSVRRTTVTLVAGRLEAAGALRCGRGYLQILDRNEIEKRCCECYGHVKTAADRLLATDNESVSIVAPGPIRATSKSA